VAAGTVPSAAGSGVGTSEIERTATAFAVDCPVELLATISITDIPSGISPFLKVSENEPFL